MYLPDHFKARDEAFAKLLIRENPLASLISLDDDGLPFVSHLPMHLEEGPDGLLLLGHCARGNPHWRYLASRPTSVVTFLGPHAYQTPKVYPDLQRVPTWNYVAVHCTVQARLVEDPLAKDRLLKKLIADHEPAYAEQWRDLPLDYTHRMLAAIVAFELEVTQLECKLKLNQHRPEAHAVMKAGYATGNEQERALSRWMERLGLGVATSTGDT